MEKNRLKKLRRRELLNMLIEVTKENEILREELEEAKKQLNDRSIKIEKAGSIAKAALEINNIFEVAQKAADQYLESIKLIEVIKDEKIENIEDEIKEKPKRGRKPKAKKEEEKNEDESLKVDEEQKLKKTRARKSTKRKQN